MGPAWGGVAFMNDMLREIIALAIIPLVIARRPAMAIGYGGATAMDFTLPVIRSSGGLACVPVAIASGLVLSFFRPGVHGAVFVIGLGTSDLLAALARRKKRAQAVAVGLFDHLLQRQLFYFGNFFGHKGQVTRRVLTPAIGHRSQKRRVGFQLEFVRWAYMRTMSRTFSALLKVVMPLKPRHQPWSRA